MGRQVLVRREGRFEGILGYGGIVENPTSTDRNLLVSGTYNPNDYSANQAKLDAWNQSDGWANHRVGIYGPDTITKESLTDTNLTFATNGEVIENWDFWRRISISGKNVKFKNCLFRGSLLENNAMVTSSSSNCENLTFEDCTFAPFAPQQSTTGWKGLAQGLEGHKFLRCDFFGAGDLIGNSGIWDKMLIKQCAFHDQAFFSPDVGGAGGIDDNKTHTDCIQWCGGNLTLDGNGIYGFYDGRYSSDRPSLDFTVPEDRKDKVYMSNRYLHMSGNTYYTRPGRLCNTSCMMISPNRYPLGNVEIVRNYIDGGAVPFNLGVFYSANSFNISDNFIGSIRRDNGPDYGDPSKRFTTAIAKLELWNMINVNNNRSLTDTSYVIPKSMMFERG